MSELERLRFDLRELTLSRDGWEERCERLEGELSDFRARILDWAARIRCEQSPNWWIAKEMVECVT